MKIGRKILKTVDKGYLFIPLVLLRDEETKFIVDGRNAKTGQDSSHGAFDLKFGVLTTATSRPHSLLDETFCIS